MEGEAKPLRTYAPADLWLWILTGALLVGILFWSILPEPPIPFRFRLFHRGGIDIYVYHALAYWALAISMLFGLTWRPHGKIQPIVSAATVTVALITLGGAMEIVQIFVHRGPDVFDATANAVGVLLGLACWGTVRSLVV